MNRCLFLLAWLLLWVTTTASTAAAQEEEPQPEDPVIAACLSSFDRSQALRREKNLLEAKKELVACSQQSCPGVVTVKCQQWLEEVKESIPTVVITAKDGNKDIFDVQVSIDDVARMESLDGTALELDIGPRKIRVVRGKETQERTVLISEGAKNRMITFDFTPAKPPPVPLPMPVPGETVEPSGPGFSMHPLSWVGFGLGLVGIIVGSITGGLAYERVGDLDQTCPGGVCPQRVAPEFGPAEALNHASTISFSVAGAGIVLGVIGLFLDEDDESCEVTSLGFSTTF